MDKTNPPIVMEKTAIPTEGNNTKQLEQELPRPIGDFILDQKDIKPVMTETGAYYHYADVCTLLKRFGQQSQLVEQTCVQPLILKYKSFIENMEWHVKTNGASEIKKKAILDQVDIYKDFIDELRMLQPLPSPPSNNKDNI